MMTKTLRLIDIHEYIDVQIDGQMCLQQVVSGRFRLVDPDSGLVQHLPYDEIKRRQHHQKREAYKRTAATAFGGLLAGLIFALVAREILK